MNYLILKFKDARLFRNGKGCKDFVSDVNGRRKRIGDSFFPDQPQFVEPITVYQISNVIHSMFGERPKSTFRKSFYDKIDYYFDKAKESYLKIDTPMFYNKVKEQDYYYKEFNMVNKMAWNSWNPNPIITWEIVKRYLGKDNFQIFFDYIKDLTNKNPYDHSFRSFRDILQDLNNSELQELLINMKRKGLYDYICDKTKSCYVTRTLNVVTAVINSGIEKTINLSGTIIVPVNDDDIDKLSYSEGVCTILDGGMVWIDSIVDESELLIHNFIKVSEISTETF